MAVSLLRISHTRNKNGELRDMHSGVHLSPALAVLSSSLDAQLERFRTTAYESSSNSEGSVTRRRRNRKGKGARCVQLVSATMAEQKVQTNFFKLILEGAVAGGTAGVVVETALYPIDTIKTRLQAARAGGKIQLKGLYAGLGGNLAGVLPASAIFVGVYEPLKRKLLEIFPDHLSSLAHLSAGAAGGAAASLVRVPTEVIKQRMQTRQFPSATTAVKQIVANEGVRGLYAGFGAFLLRDLPFDAIQFCIYEQTKIAVKRVVKRELKDPEVAIIGAISGAITGAVTTPLDVIKTRLMVQGYQGHYRGIRHCVSEIIREEGAEALFKGIGPRVMWIGIGGSVFFAVLERTKRFLQERRMLEL